jgi:glycosyltransferase involved in cell wall biosynthesis
MLAIVIPYYKLTFFEETLQSLANQTDKRFTVYIGDDASPENPAILLERYKGKFDFVYYRFAKNLGGTSLTHQWERCVALSGQEEWMMILGDDDVLGENVVESFYKLTKTVLKPIDLIRCKLSILNRNRIIIENEFDYCLYENTNRLLKRILSLVETITASEFIFSRAVYLKEGGFVNYPLAWFSDYATWLNFAELSGIYNLADAKVYWRLSEENISSNNVNLKIVKSKIESLFLFLAFLNTKFKVRNSDLIAFAKPHLKNLLVVTNYKDSLAIFVCVLINNPTFLKIKVFSDFIISKTRKKIRLN